MDFGISYGITNDPMTISILNRWMSCFFATCLFAMILAHSRGLSADQALQLCQLRTLAQPPVVHLAVQPSSIARYACQGGLSKLCFSP